MTAVLAALGSTLLFGLAQKAPCASGSWGDLRQYRMLCYTDIVPLYSTEQLQGDRLPYLDDCPGRCDEYPVVTMYAMRMAAWPVNSFTGFFYVNALLLAVAAAITAIALFRLAGQRALYFALAPSLLVYGFVNWDLLAVGFATAATLMFIRRRDVLAGVLLGLGVAAKLYPLFLLIPFAADRLRDRDRPGAIRLAASAAGTWLLVNLPFMIAAPHSWSEFFRYNARRTTDWDSLWFIVCDRLHGGTCGNTGMINVLSFLLFVALSAGTWVWRRRRDPAAPTWHLAFPILIAFLLTNKVYSPQYSLWLLPWFALALPDLRLFLAFEVTDVAVFITRFAFFGHIAGGDNAWTNGVTIGIFELAVLARTVVLVWCLIRFVVREPIGPRAPVPAETAPA